MATHLPCRRAAGCSWRRVPRRPACRWAPQPPLPMTGERFFGAVQAIYNPDRAAQAGVQWERLIFPWSLIQKDGPNTWANGYFTDQQIAQEVGARHPDGRARDYTPQWATSTPNTAKHDERPRQSLSALRRSARTTGASSCSSWPSDTPARSTPGSSGTSRTCTTTRSRTPGTARSPTCTSS